MLSTEDGKIIASTVIEKMLLSIEDSKIYAITEDREIDIIS